ncbi:Uncharacterised protein [Raoultella planticola]|uniref:Uncharacterized protein n=1 Tax=Raoultella planticola TaxID=575 RepID=A0A485BU50_RAOPL|nr:Uncharacterised protein [Raoultella planticola]
MRGACWSPSPRRGRERIDEAVESHVENERQLLAGLSTEQRQQLDRALKVFMRLLEEP